jgi:outer membrane protein OmpA-like peptidoglycan-associated protein
MQFCIVKITSQLKQTKMNTKTKIFSAVAMLMVVLISNSSLKAQDRVQPTWWFGISGAGNFDFYRGTAQILNNDLTSKYAYTNGFGVAPYMSVFVEYRPDPVWGLMVNLAYDGSRGVFDKSNAPAGYSTSLDAEFDYASFEPSLRIAPFAGKFYIFIGPRLSYNAMQSFSIQSDNEPNTQAQWSNVYGMRLSAQIGMGYEMPLSAPANLTQVDIAPFIAFLPYFGNQPRSVENLTLTTVRAGVAIKIGCGHRAQAVSEVTPVPLEKDVQFSVQAPSSVPGQHIVIETLPLCNYVFFDSGTTTIPARYAILNQNEAAGFTEAQLQDCQKNPGTRSSRQLTMYHNILNIIGDRMRKYPTSKIQLVGSSAGRGIEIGKENAEAVKSYLVNTFGIDGSRIAVEGRNEPLTPSEEPNDTRDFALTRAEDNRVSINSTSPDLMMEVKDNSALCLKPIEVTAMDGSSNNDSKVTLNATGAGETLATWSVDVTDPQGNVEHFGPFTDDQATISGATILGNNTNGNYKIAMTGETKSGHSITKESSFALVREVQPIQTEQRVSILFQFDKSVTVATFDNFLTNTVAPRIYSNSNVVITGYTDIVGTEDYNLNLSSERAQAAQSILQGALAKTNVTGVTYKTSGHGEAGTVFSNTLPEERFYNRTVTITIVPSGPVVVR